MSEPTEPTFKYESDDDSRALWWSHTCSCPDLVADPTGGTYRRVTQLPISLTEGWVVVHAEPLTVSPSIMCMKCGTHGWIRDGKWVNAA